MTKMARVAPSGLMRYRGLTFGKEFEGNLFAAEFNTGRIMPLSDLHRKVQLQDG